MSWGIEVFRSDGLVVLSSNKKLSYILGKIHTTQKNGSVIVPSLIDTQGEFFYSLTGQDITKTLHDIALRAVISLDVGTGTISWDVSTVGDFNSFSFNYGISI